MTLNALPSVFRLAGAAALVWSISSVPAAYAADGCANQAAVMSPAPMAAPGLGGTGQHAAKPGLGGTGIEGGFGGTGQQAARPGMGGTGIEGGVGGTGIVGVITGFASVCVNGVEVHFDATTPVSEYGKSVPQNALAVGKLVSIQALNQGQAFAARSISVMNTVVGPVQAVNAKRGEITVLGQTVLAPSPAVVVGLRSGQWVQVSGYRQASGAIEASFVGAVPPQAQAQLTGVFERNMGVDVLVSGTDVRLEHTRLPSEVERGSEVAITGDWDGSTLRARTVVAEPTQRSLGAARSVLLEGLVRAVSARSISLGQQSLSLDRKLEVLGGDLKDVSINQRVRVFGQLDDNNRIQVNRLEIHDGGRRSGSDNGRRSGRRSGGDDDASRDRDRDRDRSSDRSEKSGSDSSGRSDRSGSSGSSGSGKSGGD